MEDAPSGHYVLDDPRPIAKDAPYTFFLPAPHELAALKPGDTVKLMFRSIPQSAKWDAERMWVEITAIESTGFAGILSNEPSDMPQLKAGDEIHFQAFHILATEKVLPGKSSVREYWERCLVDKCVTDDKVPVHFLYREEPDMQEENDRYPDSGWRIRGDYRGLSDERIEARNIEYIAIGKVLNVDDSWLHLIDAPVGSAFIKNFETGEFAPEKKLESSDDNE